MFKYCDNCIKKHKNKICECKYNEVIRLIELINFEYKSSFILKSCPDEDRDDMYTADLKFVDENLGENLYIEVKEVKIGYENKEHNNKGNKNEQIGKENGQMYLSNCINIAINKLEKYKSDIMNKYIICIPKTHIDEDDYQCFIDKFTDFLNEKIIGNRENSTEFTFIRSRRQEEVKIKISIKEESINVIIPTLAYEYDSEVKTILQIYDNIGNLDKIINGVKDNFYNTEKVSKKFPKNDGKRILLNILRFPFGEEIFFNAFLKENFYKLQSIKDSIEISNYKSIDESYLLYYFEDGFYYEDNKIKFSKNLLLYINILGNLSYEYLIRFE